MGCTAALGAEQRPNILWITLEDRGPDFSCYGRKGVKTPHSDRLAEEGVLYENVFATAPVCSPSRSTMMTGFYQNRIGANQHRTREKKALPEGIRPIPHLLADAGYFTCLMSAKVDVNFLPDQRGKLFQGRDWKERKEGQPFFARITFDATHRPWKRDGVSPIDPAEIDLPPTYADTPLIRRDRANGLEQLQRVDRKIGKLLERLDQEGLREKTLVILTADHGSCHFRAKQFLYEEGIRVPLILRWPGKLEAGKRKGELVSLIDLPATVMAVAGVEAPVPLQGRDLLGEQPPRKYVFAARDKMDQTHDAMRMVRNIRFKLIENLMPERPWLQLNVYKESSYPDLAEMSLLHAQGKLNAAQARIFAKTKPRLELYDLWKDPHELVNLADEEGAQGERERLEKVLQQWRTEVIQDVAPSPAFRAEGIYQDFPKDGTVAEWVKANEKKIDFEKYGWPFRLPTRSAAEWKAVVELWKPWVYRKPDSPVKRPIISGTP